MLAQLITEDLSSLRQSQTTKFMEVRVTLGEAD